MPASSRDTVTRLLAQMREGEADALDRLFPLVYSTLKKLSRAQLRRGQGAELATTELVHETYLKMLGSSAVEWQSRGHFLGVAVRAMRQVLVDDARRRLADKRGGGQTPVTLAGRDGTRRMSPETLLAVDEALERLDALSPRLRQVVELRFFGGLHEREIAELLAVTPRTVARAWLKARLFLHREVYPDERLPG